MGEKWRRGRGSAAGNDVKMMMASGRQPPWFLLVSEDKFTSSPHDKIVNEKRPA